MRAGGSDRILLNLGELARAHPELGLLQFQTLVSGRQYSRLYSLIERYVPSGAAVLDWGCGNGHASYALAALGYRATGYSLDPPPPVARFVPAAEFVSGTGADPERLPFADASFDAVLSVGVLEHVRETGGTEEASLREIRRVLRPEGVFLCFHLPNRFSYIEAAAQWIPGMHHHGFRFTPKRIRAMCAPAGLEIVALGRYGALPRNPWQSVPPAIGNRRLAANLWDGLDALGAFVVRPVLQNFWFVARPR